MSWWWIVVILVCVEAFFLLLVLALCKCAGDADARAEAWQSEYLEAYGEEAEAEDQDKQSFAPQAEPGSCASLASGGIAAVNYLPWLSYCEESCED